MKSLKFSCPDDLRGWLEQKADREERSISSVIRYVLREAKYEEETIRLEEEEATA